MAWDSLLKSMHIFCLWSREGIWLCLRSLQVTYHILLSLHTKTWIKVPDIRHLFWKLSRERIKKVCFQKQSISILKNMV